MKYDYFIDSCVPGEFMCADRACIPMKSLCDGTVDCVNGTDELGCGKYSACP